jgi:hypothetical protein
MGSAGTKFCMPGANKKFAEDPPVIQVSMNSDGSASAVGGGCVLRPLREIWATINNLDVMKFVAADSYTATRTVNPMNGFTHLYEITYSKSTPIGSISWTIDWFHGYDIGTFLAPGQVNIKYDRVSGTSLIPVWNGGIVLTKVLDNVTSIAILNTFKAAQSDSANESSAHDALNEMIGHARDGAADWTNLNSGLKADPSQPDPPTPPYQ